MSVQKAEQVWEAVLGDLQLRVTRPSYETWLKGTVGLDHLDGEFVVGTPNTFVAEMLEQRMYSLISQALEKIVDGPPDIRFRVIQPAPLANAAVGAAPDAHPSDHQAISSTAQATSDTNPSALSSGGRTQQHGLDRSLPANFRRSVDLNTRYTFDSFIVGSSNELAHAAALAVSERPGITYNPLFIYSGVGLGKTHLLHAIGHRVASSGLALVYTTTEEFTNEYIKAIRDGKTEDFRDRYRSADVLLLDDIQFIIGKEQTQEGFFHTFNALHMAARQIVITSDRPVTALTLLEDRVRSRLGGGLTADIQSPDLETRLAILRARAEDTGQLFPSDVLQFLAERIHQNIRELEGCLTRVAAYAQLVQHPITLDLVKKAIAHSLHSANRRRVTDEAILDAVSSYFGIEKDTLRGRRRDKNTALARQVAMYLLREETHLPLAAIGRVLGGKDHTTVLHAYHRIAKEINLDVHLRQDVINIRGALLTA